MKTCLGAPSREEELGKAMMMMLASIGIDREEQTDVSIRAVSSMAGHLGPHNQCARRIRKGKNNNRI